MSESVGVSEGLRRALSELATTHTLLVALDFDGVLAPLVDRPEDSRPLPRSAAAVKVLAALPNTTTALISGRALASLRATASPEAQTLLIGSHGAETWAGPDAAPLELDRVQGEALGKATAVVRKVVAAHPQTSVELKPAGVVLHTRRAEPPVADAATAQARQGLTELDGVHVSSGKSVLEASVIKADKGQGLCQLGSLTGATATLYAGDDVTDEDAFKVLHAQDLGIKVGPGETAAAFRVGSPEEFAAVLEELARLRRQAVNTP